MNLLLWVMVGMAVVLIRAAFLNQPPLAVLGSIAKGG